MNEVASRHAPRERRLVLLLHLLSLVTAVWLVLQLFAITTVRSTTWPFSALTMFSGPRQEAVVITLSGTTADGTRRIDEDDFGFAGRNQLHVYVRTRVVEVDGQSVTARSQAGAAARALVGLYNQRHDRPLQQLSVHASVTELPLDGDRAERRFRVVSVRP
jgi:hypothetical protein